MVLCSDRYQKLNLSKVKQGRGEFFDCRNQLVGMAEGELAEGLAEGLFHEGTSMLQSPFPPAAELW